MHNKKETIFALATPKGISAIAVFRISGSKTHEIIKKISSHKKWRAKQTEINYILDNKKNKVDQTLTTLFKAPKTYTGEDMAEISCHGGLAIINKITKTLIDSGMKIAKPGEFTKRSLQNGKIDVTQAESISDLVNAETEKQRILALNNLGGELSLFLKELRKKIIKMLADAEAIIDFSDEELPKNIFNSIKEQNKNIIKEIKYSLKKSLSYKPIRDGFLISVIGKPNTGKSSFVNYISGREVAIVTNIPGTTTDTLETQLEIDGYKFRFIDTAGIRKYRNKIEKIGINKTYKIVNQANLNIVFLEKLEKEKYKNIKNKVFVRSKADIRRKIDLDKKIYKISSVTGFGVRRLVNKIKKELIKSDMEKTPLFSRERQISKMRQCLKTLESINFNSSIDIISEDIRSSLKNVEEIYQKFDIEQILDIIFSDFCIGK